MKLTELFKTGTGLATMIKGQGEITNMAPFITGTRGPLAKVLATPTLGDGKLFRTSGANDAIASSPQAQAIQKQHSPVTHREIGKRAALSITGKERALITLGALPMTVRGFSEGYSDRGKTDTGNLIRTTGEAAGIGALTGATHGLVFPELYGTAKGQYKSKWVTPLLMAMGFGAASAAAYGAGRITHPLADKLFFDHASN